MTHIDMLEHLFNSCDSTGSGTLTVDDLQRINPGLSSKEVKFIFDQMDADHDGMVTKNDFIDSYQRVISQSEKKFPNLGRRASLSISGQSDAQGTSRRKENPSVPEVVYHSDDCIKFDQLQCQDELLALYQQIQTSGVPELLTQFEKVVGSVVREVKEQRDQNDRLQQLFEKDREHYYRVMNEVESEMDQQLAAAAAKARREERERLERERDEMRKKLETEIVELQTNVKRLQKMETVLAEGNEKSQKLTEMRQKLQELMEENRRLKGSLTEAQTSMAVVNAEFATLRLDYDEKYLDLLTEKETLLAAIDEQDNMSRQVQLLYDANKKLHDTNDNLRSALEQRQAFCKKYNMRTPSPITSIGGSSLPSRQESFSSIGSSLSARFGGITPDSGLVVSRPNYLNVPANSWSGSNPPCQRSQDSAEDDNDSGLAMHRGENDTTTDDETVIGRRTPSRQLAVERNDSDPIDEMDEIEADVGDRTKCRSTVMLMQTGTYPSPTRWSSPHFESVDLGLQLPTMKISKAKINLEPTGPPERTFRVVMAGDASVGKSSFIMRLCRGEFIPNLPSTLGVDFHVRTLNVDGKNVAIQVWDTAGQERFRSLCKSYFRRTDGAVMMYDCTCEQSFLNVRNWMETIQESAPKPIPVLICGNKIDLRIAAAADGLRCISTEEGQKLAKTFKALFFEVSAKDGTNIVDVLLTLAREMFANEDYDVKSSTLILKQPIDSRTCRNYATCSNK